MEQLNPHNFVAQLRVQVPEFRVDEDDAEDHLLFVIFGDLTLHAARLIAQVSAPSVTVRIFDFIEHAACSTDSLIIEVTSDALHELAVRCPEEARERMGPCSLRLFEPVLDDVFGPPPLLNRLFRSLRALRARSPN